MIKKISLLFLGIILLTNLGACTMIDDNTNDDAARIARDDLGFENIIFVASGKPNSILIKENVGMRGICYVIGERKEQSVLLIVPREKNLHHTKHSGPLSFH